MLSQLENKEVVFIININREQITNKEFMIESATSSFHNIFSSSSFSNASDMLFFQSRRLFNDLFEALSQFKIRDEDFISFFIALGL